MDSLEVVKYIGAAVLTGSVAVMIYSGVQCIYEIRKMGRDLDAFVEDLRDINKATESLTEKIIRVNRLISY